MAKVGTAEYDVELSRAKVRREVDAVGKDIEAGLGASSRKVEAEFARTAKRAVAGFAVYKGGQFLNDSIQAASNLSEQQNKVNVVFGESSDVVNKFASNSAEALGQSKRQALEAAGTFGNLFRAIGLSESQSAKFSTTLVGLASDLASFNNTSPEEALQALRSGLVGEIEPLRKYGVNLNEVALKQKAMALGLSDGKGVLDANAKAQAAYALIMEQTGLAQGDFARTSGGLANQQRILAAEWENAKASLGESLIPAMKLAVRVAEDFLKVFGLLPSGVQAGVLAIGGLTFAVGLFGPTMKAGALALRGLGASAVQAGANLIVPTAAVEGLAAAEVEATAATAGLELSLAAIAAPLAVAYGLYKGIKNATDGKFGSLHVNIDDRALGESNAKLKELAQTITLFDASKFSEVPLTVLKAMLSTLDKSDPAYKAVTHAIREQAAADKRAAANKKEFGDATDTTTGAIDTETQALQDQQKWRQALIDGSQAQIDKAHDLFDAKIAEQGTSKALSKALADESQARREAAGDSDEYRAAQKAIVEDRSAVVDATRDVQKAVESLAEARQEATRSLRDERLENERSIISAERAKFAVEDSRDRLAQVEDDPRATDREKAQALLDVKDAELSLQEAQNKRGDSAADLARDERNGIEGSDAVVAAKERVTSALDAQSEAEKKVGEDSRAAAKILTDAKAKVAEASDKVRDAVFAEADAQEKIALLAYGAAAGNDAFNASLKRTLDLLDPRSPLAQEITRFLGELQTLGALSDLLDPAVTGVGIEGTGGGHPLPAGPATIAQTLGPLDSGTGSGGLHRGGKTVNVGTINVTRSGATAKDIAHELTFGND